MNPDNKRGLLAAAFGAALARGEIGQLDGFNFSTSPVLSEPTPMRVRRQAKSRGGRMQRQSYGNPPGKYAPHQGKKEMARRVRNIALGRYNKEQLG